MGRFIPRNPQHRPQYQWSRQGGAAAAIIEAVRPYLLVKRDQADLALALCEHLEFGRCEDPFPWFGPDYDPKSAREEMHFEMVALNQSRSRRRELDGRTWDQYPTG
ncbi:MAG: hypothetical protein ACRDXE_08180 [Acidimicrobiales bacterium]